MPKWYSIGKISLWYKLYLGKDSQNYRDAVTNTRLARPSSARLCFREILFTATLAVGGTASVCLSFNTYHMVSIVLHCKELQASLISNKALYLDFCFQPYVAWVCRQSLCLVSQLSVSSVEHYLHSSACFRYLSSRKTTKETECLFLHSKSTSCLSEADGSFTTKDG